MSQPCGIGLTYPLQLIGARTACLAGILVVRGVVGLLAVHCVGFEGFGGGSGDGFDGFNVESGGSAKIAGCVVKVREAEDGGEMMSQDAVQSR